MAENSISIDGHDQAERKQRQVLFSCSEIKRVRTDILVFS